VTVLQCAGVYGTAPVQIVKSDVNKPLLLLWHGIFIYLTVLVYV
jgi:hypothetical protein